MAEETPFDPIEVELRDGRRVRVREIRPDDLSEVRQAFDRLSSQSRYTRFMSPMRTLPPHMLERAVHLREEHGQALVAEIDAADGIDLVGGARYYVEPDGERCEFAVTVDDRWQSAGLAARLMRELIGAARARGLKHMEGFVLSENRRMLALARRLGFTARLDPGDATVTIVSLDLTALTATGSQ
jgi:RimJ/RimL family protein N-acetyltransferase